MAQHMIACTVAQRVIHRFEVIKIHLHDAQAPEVKGGISFRLL